MHKVRAVNNDFSESSLVVLVSNLRVFVHISAAPLRGRRGKAL